MTKISALSDIGTSVASNDTFVLVDVSDPTTPNKKIQQQNLFLIPDGSAGTPAVRFLNDTDVGLFRPTTNTLAFATGGSERLRIDSSGRVGLGTSSPVIPLDVNTGAAGAPVVGFGESGNDPFIHLERFTGAANYDAVRISSVFGSAQGGILTISNGTGATKGQQTFTERLRIDSSGRVGVGTTEPGNLLELKQDTPAFRQTSVGESGGYVATFGLNWNTSNTFNITANATGQSPVRILKWGSDGDLTLNYSSASSSRSFVVTDGAAERFRCDSSGRLLVGTSTARSTGYGSTAAFQLESTSFPGAAASLTNNQASAAGPSINFLKTRGTALGANTLVANNDVLGRIVFSGADGATSIQGAIITADVDGTPGLNDLPTRLVFSTTADGASSPTERMIIKNNGNILVGSNSDAGFTFQVSKASGAAGYFNRNTDDGAVVGFGRQASLVGTISVTTTATAYNTSSDYRLKENVTAVTDGITRLQQLKPSRFNFIADPTKTVDGFLAHEVQDIVPEAITGEKDAVDENGDPEYQGIDQSKLVPLLTAALQEAIGRIETLEAEVAALKAQ